MEYIDTTDGNLTHIWNITDYWNLTDSNSVSDYIYSDQTNTTTSTYETTPLTRVSDVLVKCIQVFAEPIPNWRVAINAWGHAWEIHVYVFGIGFFAIAASMFIATLTIYGQRTQQKYIVSLHLIILICGLCRGLYLLVDPYGSRLVLPLTFSYVLYGIGQPCLTSAFSLLQWTFIRITQVNFGPCDFPSFRTLNIFMVFHFLLVVLVYFLVAVFPLIRILLVLTETIFIISGLILCGIFVSKSFKMTEFTSETQKALKQLSKYNLHKHESEAKRKEMNVKRVKRPRIRITNDDDTLSGLTDTTSGTSGSSDTGFVSSNRAHRRHTSKNEQQNSVAEERNSLIQSLERKPSFDVIFNADTVTVIGSNSISNGQDASTEPANLTKVMSFCKTSSKSECSLPVSSSDSGSVFTVDDFAQYCDRSKPCYGESPSMDDVDDAISNNEPETPFEIQWLPPRDSVFELGYMADTEPGSPAKKLDSDENSEPWAMLPRDTSYTTISFHRIRQGRTLHNLVKLSYVTTMFQFILCILHLYAMFGVYGVLSNHQKVEPWPWLTFHSCFRFAELGMCATIAYVTVALGISRHKSTERKRRKASRVHTIV